MKKAIFILPAIKGGGAEKFVLTLYRALEDNLNYQCHIISLSREVHHEIEHFRVHFLDKVKEINSKGFGKLTYRKNIAKLVDEYIEKNIGSDSLILSNMTYSDKVMSMSKHRIYHVIHNSYKQVYLDGRPRFKQFLVKRKISKIYGNHPLVFVSKGAHDSFCNNFKADVRKYIIYNPLNSDEIYTLANEYAVDIAGDFIVHVGRFNKAKRHDRLLNAFAKLKTNVKLVLLGEGKLEKDIKEQVINLNLQERVIFAGFKKNPYPYIKNAKALVLTSDFEGLPTVLLEAISLDVPVVSTDCSGGVREIVGSSESCLVPLVDLNVIANAFDEAVSNPSKYIAKLDGRFKPEVAAREYDKLNLN